MSKESFKLFVRNHPELAEYVVKNDISFQKFYEIYDIYGEQSSVWDKYFKIKKKSSGDDLITKLKNADPKDLQKGITNIQKALSMFDFSDASTSTKPYEERPMYKYFED